MSDIVLRLTCISYKRRFGIWLYSRLRAIGCHYSALFWITSGSGWIANRELSVRLVRLPLDHVVWPRIGCNYNSLLTLHFHPVFLLRSTESPTQLHVPAWLTVCFLDHTDTNYFIFLTRRLVAWVLCCSGLACFSYSCVAFSVRSFCGLPVFPHISSHAVCMCSPCFLHFRSCVQSSWVRCAVHLAVWTLLMLRYVRFLSELLKTSYLTQEHYHLETLFLIQVYFGFTLYLSFFRCWSCVHVLWYI